MPVQKKSGNLLKAPHTHTHTHTHTHIYIYIYVYIYISSNRVKIGVFFLSFYFFYDTSKIT